MVMEKGRWADRLMPFQSALDTWRASRDAFASDVKAWEWGLVEGCFSNLQRTIPMIEPGEQITPDDRDVIAALKVAAIDAREVVEPHMASQREREQTAKELQKRLALHRQASGGGGASQA